MPKRAMMALAFFVLFSGGSYMGWCLWRSGSVHIPSGWVGRFGAGDPADWRGHVNGYQRSRALMMMVFGALTAVFCLVEFVMVFLKH